MIFLNLGVLIFLSGNPYHLFMGFSHCQPPSHPSLLIMLRIPVMDRLTMTIDVMKSLCLRNLKILFCIYDMKFKSFFLFFSFWINVTWANYWIVLYKRCFDIKNTGFFCFVIGSKTVCSFLQNVLVHLS